MHMWSFLSKSEQSTIEQTCRICLSNHRVVNIETKSKCRQVENSATLNYYFIEFKLDWIWHFWVLSRLTNEKFSFQWTHVFTKSGSTFDKKNV